MTATAPLLLPADPDAAFAVLWPHVQRYAGRVAGKVAGGTGLDRDDLFAAAALAVWRQLLKGAIAAAPNPLWLTTVVIRRAVLTAAERERRHRRLLPASNWRIGGGDDDTPLLDTIEARPDHGDGLTLDEADGFDRLLGLARPQDRDVLTARFRDGDELTAVAERFGISRQRVNQKVATSVARIRKQLQPEAVTIGRRG